MHARWRSWRLHPRMLGCATESSGLDVCVVAECRLAAQAVALGVLQDAASLPAQDPSLRPAGAPALTAILQTLALWLPALRCGPEGAILDIVAWPTVVGYGGQRTRRHDDKPRGSAGVSARCIAPTSI